MKNWAELYHHRYKIFIRIMGIMIHVLIKSPGMITTQKQIHKTESTKHPLQTKQKKNSTHSYG